MVIWSEATIPRKTRLPNRNIRIESVETKWNIERVTAKKIAPPAREETQYPG